MRTVHRDDRGRLAPRPRARTPPRARHPHHEGGVGIPTGNHVDVPGGRKPWELSAENRRELGYDFLVPAACAALNATTVKPPKIESSEGRRARRAARLAKARRRKPSLPTKERVPKWVHVVEE